MEKSNPNPGPTWARLQCCNPLYKWNVRGKAVIPLKNITFDWIFDAPVILMDNRKHKGPGRVAPPAKNKGKGKDKRTSRRQDAQNAGLKGNAKLIERVRQIISETPEIRPDKVAPLQEAVEQGTYEIDVRKLANILIAKLFLDS